MTEQQTMPLEPPSIDPDSWEATKQVEEFNRRIRDFELQFTEGAKNFSYEAKENELSDDQKKGFSWQGKPRVLFPNRYAFAYVAYHRARVANAPIKIIFQRVHEVWIYIQQAYAGVMFEPGPAPFSKIGKLTADNEKLQQNIKDLTEKLQECEMKRKWGIKDDQPLEGDLSKP